MTTLAQYMKSMETYKPYAAMLLVQIIYAGMALFSKKAISGEEGMNSYVFVTYRQAFATLALAPFALFIKSEKAVPLSSMVLLKIFLISFFGLTLSLNLYYIAIKHTTATFAAATTNVIPAITFAMALLLRMERLSIRKVHGIAKVVGSAVGVSGALVYALVKGPALKGPALVNHNDSSSKHGPLKHCCSKGDWLKGSLVMILANTLWSLWLVLQGRMVKQYPAKVRFITINCAFSCIQSAIVAVILEREASAWKLGWNIHLYSIAYCGVIVTGLAYWLQLWAIQKKGPVFAAMFTPLALIVAAIFSAIVWKEVVYLGSVGGAVLLVGGLYLVLWGKNKEEQHSKSNGKISNQDMEAAENADAKDETTTTREFNAHQSNDEIDTRPYNRHTTDQLIIGGLEHENVTP
ncbi:WAT1-related protein At1g43650 [Linum perenne]